MIKKLIYIYLIFDIVLILASLIIGHNWLINTQISFLCSILIIYTTIKTYERKIDKELHSGKYDDIYMENTKKSKKKSSKIETINRWLTFFAPFKLLAYCVLALGFYLLVKVHIINPIAFLVGILPIPFGVIIYGIKYDK